MKTVVVAVTFGLLFGGSYVATTEGRALLDHALNPDEAFEALAQGDARPATSPFSKRSSLNSCLAALTSSYGLAQPTESRDGVLDACDTITREITSENPTDSFGWSIAALVAGERRNNAAFSDDLHRSFETARYEDWAAELRFHIGQDHWELGDPRLQAEQKQDVAVMAQSNEGAAAIADRFVARADFRDRASSWLNSLPPGDAQRVIDAIDAARKARSPS